jgi:hypothetical protein
MITHKIVTKLNMISHLGCLGILFLSSYKINLQLYLWLLDAR